MTDKPRLSTLDSRLSTPNIGIVSGEMSGDLVGGALAQALLKKRPDVTLWGIGSRRMQSAGVELLYNSAEWSAIGIIESLKLYPRLRFTAYPHVLREIARRKPAAVVLIDFGAFNVKVARWCKANGFRVLWYFPSGSWRRKGKVYPEQARITDRIATPFPWSAERLQGVGANAEFVGHPLLELVRPTSTRAQFADRFGMEPGKPIIGLLPGSRGFEIQYNTPAMLGASEIVYRALPDAQFVIAAGSSLSRQRVEEQLTTWFERAVQQAAPEEEPLAEERASEHARRLVTNEGFVVPGGRPDSDFKKRLTEASRRKNLLPIVIAEDLTYDVMAHSDALLVCSGTATLEAALLNTPMAIVYRGSKLMEMETKLLHINPEHIGLPNIILDERVVPEFIQDAATPEALAKQLLLLLRDPEVRGNMKAALQRVRDTLSPPANSTLGTSERTAQIALELAGLG